MAPTAGEQHAAAAAATAAAAAAAAGSCSSEADCATPSSAATAAASLLAALGELADIQQPSLQEGDSDYELDEYEQLDLGDLFVNTDLREEVQDALARFLRPERVLLRDKLTFMLGIMHMVLSAYWLGCSPQYAVALDPLCVLAHLCLPPIPGARLLLQDLLQTIHDGGMRVNNSAISSLSLASAALLSLGLVLPCKCTGYPLHFEADQYSAGKGTRLPLAMAHSFEATPPSCQASLPTANKPPACCRSLLHMPWGRCCGPSSRSVTPLCHTAWTR